jgi:WD40 repeat protein
LGTCALSHPEILMNKPGYSDLGEVVPAIPGMQLRHTLRGHWREIISMAWSPDGIVLASGARDKTVRVWNTETGECLGTLTGYRNLPRWGRLATRPDGRPSYPFVESFWIQLANSLRVELEWIKDFFRTGSSQLHQAGSTG